MVSNRVSFFRLNCSEKAFESLKHSIKESKFNEKEDFGILKFRNLDTYFSGILLIKTPVYLPVVDLNTLAKSKKEESYTYDIIPFGGDYQYQLLEVYASKGKWRKIDSFFSEVGVSGVGISEIDNTMPDLMNTIKKKMPDFSITGLTMNNFSFAQGVLGKFSAKISNNSTGKKLINEYTEAITAAEVVLKMEKEPLRLKISPPATFQYWIPQELNVEALNFLKRLFYKKIHTSISQIG